MTCRLLLLCALVPWPCLADDARPVDQISQAAIQSAFQVLQRDYIRREDLTFDQLNRAALQGLLERLAFGAEIIKDEPGSPSAAGRVLGEELAPKVGYLRPTQLVETEVAMLEASLKEHAGKGATHVMLDLRAVAQPGSFETAAAILELFLPRGTVLFKLKQLGGGDAQLFISKRDPVWTGSLIVLADADTNNVAEAVAASLQHEHRALLVGSTTRGATVRYGTVPLDAGWRLRFARAEMMLPDDTSVFRKGLTPDFDVALDPKTKRNIFLLSASGSMKTFVFEQPRPRFNEAALVSGKNPDIDEFIRRSTGDVSVFDQPPARDKVVQRALDLLQSTDHFAQAKLRWNRVSPDDEQVGPAFPKAVPVKP